MGSFAIQQVVLTRGGTPGGENIHIFPEMPVPVGRTKRKSKILNTTMGLVDDAGQKASGKLTASGKIDYGVIYCPDGGEHLCEFLNIFFPHLYHYLGSIPARIIRVIEKRQGFKDRHLKPFSLCTIEMKAKGCLDKHGMDQAFLQALTYAKNEGCDYELLYLTLSLTSL